MQANIKEVKTAGERKYGLENKGRNNIENGDIFLQNLNVQLFEKCRCFVGSSLLLVDFQEKCSSYDSHMCNRREDYVNAIFNFLHQ